MTERYYGDWVAPKPTPKAATSSFSFMLAVSRLAEMAAGLNNTAEAAHYTAALQTYRAAWHAAYYANTTGDSSCTVGGVTTPCQCPGKLVAVAMECEPKGHGVPPPTCGESSNTRLTLTCAPGTGTIQNITFAAFGEIGGDCASGFTATGCHSPATQEAVEAACLGKTSCSIDASMSSVAGGNDPCPGMPKTLAVMAEGCTAAKPAPPRVKSSYAGDTQTGNTMALYLKVPPTDEIRQSTVESLVADYHAAGDHPTFGTVGARYFLPVLAENGQMEVALDFATKTTQPSYGFMVSTPEMPGTIWEQWGGDAYNAAGSKNHPMFCGGIGVFLYQLAGLRSLHASSRRVDIVVDRVAVNRVGSASVSFTTVNGPVSWSWVRNGTEFSADVSLPHGLLGASLKIPLEAHHTHILEGQTVIWARKDREEVALHRINGVDFVKGEVATVSMSLTSGNFSFLLR